MEARRKGDRDLPRQLQGRPAAVGGKGGKAAAAPPPTPLRERKRLPEDRPEIGRKFQVGEYEGYIHVGLYDDGSPGDIFVDIAKDGTTMAGLMNSLMIAVSMGLQYGVPPEVYVSKLAHMRFEPSGLTNDADIRVAKSIVDYIFRWFGKKFLTPEQQEEAGILSAEVKARLAERYAAATTAARPRGRVAAARPDGALQLVGGRGRVREVRRPDDPHRLVLHVPRLRDEHRLLLSSSTGRSLRGGPRSGPPRFTGRRRNSPGPGNVRTRMIARTWRGWTRRENSDAYLAYVERTGGTASRGTPGNKGFYVLRRDYGDRTEFVTISLWESLEAIRGFAGKDSRSCSTPRTTNTSSTENASSRTTS